METSPERNRLETMLAKALAQRASDLHLSAGRPPAMRIDGRIGFIEAEKMTDADMRGMLLAIVNESSLSEFERAGSVDFSVSMPCGRFRVNAFATDSGMSMAFRAIRTDAPDLDTLGAPAVMKNLARLDKGLVLVTGPTGSGKSTTLAAIIDHINRHDQRHILTIEDPIEFIHESKRCLVNQRQIGRDARSFADALRAALREDPDVILVGEMRDLETISLALTAAETGHLVLGTLHTSSASKTVNRIMDVFPAGDKDLVANLFASSLQAVIAQKLLRSPGGGRCGAYEVMIATPAIRNLIRGNKVPQIDTMIQLGQQFGMQTMKESIESLVLRGKVDAAEASAVIAEMEADKLSDMPAQSAGEARRVSNAPPPNAAPAVAMNVPSLPVSNEGVETPQPRRSFKF